MPADLDLLLVSTEFYTETIDAAIGGYLALYYVAIFRRNLGHAIGQFLAGLALKFTRGPFWDQNLFFLNWVIREMEKS